MDFLRVVFTELGHLSDIQIHLTMLISHDNLDLALADTDNGSRFLGLRGDKRFGNMGLLRLF